MGRKSYLGGHSIEGAWLNPYRLDNTAPEYIGSSADANPMKIDAKLADDLQDEIKGMGFDFACAIFRAAQHGFLHGDITGFIHAAKKFDIPGLDNYYFRIANQLMCNKRFTRVQGTITISRGEGPFSWNLLGICQVYSAMLAESESCDIEWGYQQSPPALDRRLRDAIFRAHPDALPLS